MPRAHTLKYVADNVRNRFHYLVGSLFYCTFVVKNDGIIQEIYCDGIASSRVFDDTGTGTEAQALGVEGTEGCEDVYRLVSRKGH